MGGYYQGEHAKQYNTRWRTFTQRTLAEALTLSDVSALQGIQERLGRPPRVLDVACGTGILLKLLLERVPNLEAVGVDASSDMLAQASATLKDQSHIRLVQGSIGPGETAGLPFAPHTFDLITCTNVLHDLPEPGATLSGLHRLLVPGGHLVLEDFARREPLFSWAVFAWLVRWIEGSYRRAYTLAEAQAFCAQEGFIVLSGKSFVVDWLWRGWVLAACVASTEETLA